MGFELEVVEDLGGAQTKPLASKVLHLEREAQILQNTWDGALPKEELLALCKRLAENLGMDNIGDPTKNQKPVDLQKGRLEYVPTPTDRNIVNVKFLLKDESIKVIIRPDRFGPAPSVCPSCGSDTSKKSSLAHNVIPQAVWKDIVDDTLKDFDMMVRSGALLEKQDSYGKPLVKRFDTNKSLYEDNGNILPLQTLRDKSKATLQQLHAINNIWGAQGGARQQCPNCELIQSNATLIQRAKLLMDDSIVEGYFSKIPKTSFVGTQFSDLATNDQEGVNKALQKATLRQVGRYLQGLEDRIGKLYQDEENKGFSAGKGKGPDNVEPLIFLLWDHLAEFVWCFRAVALRKCEMPYTRSDTALRTKPVTV